jgi:preprotein translocase subunit SecE
MQDLVVKMVEGWPPGEVLVMKVFPASQDLSHPEANSTQCIGFVFEVDLQFARISWASRLSFVRNLMMILCSNSTCMSGKRLLTSCSKLLAG